MSYATIDTAGFLFGETKLRVDLLHAEFGDGYETASLIGSNQGTRAFNIRIDVLPDDVNLGVAGPDHHSLAAYLWEFWLASKIAGDKPFQLADPKDATGATMLYGSFVEDELTFAILCSLAYSTGLNIKQRRIRT